MESKTLDKVLDVAGGIAKATANLSEATPKHSKEKTETSSNASTGSQNIQIHMAPEKQVIKPVEKYIQKFPESRPLTPEECELALKIAQMNHGLQSDKQLYFERVTDREWAHKLEVERKNERKRKIRGIIGGLFAALGVGVIGYSVYSDYRGSKNQAMVKKALPERSTVDAEGTVE